MLYAAYAAACILINFALPEVPLSLGLCFSMLLCGTNILMTPLIFIGATAVCLNLAFSAIALFGGLFLSLIVFLYRRTGRKLKAETAVYLAVALAPYVIFAQWRGFGAVSGLNPYILKTIAAAVTAAFTYFCFKSVYAIIFRVYRCRLKEDELVCLAVVFIAVGEGLYSLAGEGVYLCFFALSAAFFVRLSRSPSAIIAGIIMSVPHSVAIWSLHPMTAYVVITVAVLIFVNVGRFAPSVVSGGLTAAYMYMEGCFKTAVPFIVLYAFLLFAGCVAAALPDNKTVERLKRRLLCENALDGSAVARSRRRTGERLFKISELFREIECAFTSLEDTVDDVSARGRMFSQLREVCCAGCEKAKKCEKTGVYTGLKRLIDAGCLKGRVSLIDLPAEVAAECRSPAQLINALNGILNDYRRFMAENENARSGRKLLADQAHGVAEVMKGCAVELSRTSGRFTDSEAAVKKAFQAHGISCTEVQIDDLYCEISVAVYGKFDIKEICAVLSEALGKKFVLKDKLPLDAQKLCLVFTSPPALDAAFGVACTVKSGEKVSGDTHSVIKINEHSFLMALSDGMGSGEYARKVSQSAISLIEAFYRAEMPEDTVLKTINKLLSFNRDERFVCIDIVAVNLDSGRADFIKIGSPAGIIVREGEIKVLEGNSLPMGILENLKPNVCSEFLKQGDIVVFMSDGITSSFSSATDMYEYLQTLKPLNPQNLADKILAEALSRTGGTAYDDMTVVCTRLFENG